MEVFFFRTVVAIFSNLFCYTYKKQLTPNKQTHKHTYTRFGLARAMIQIQKQEKITVRYVAKGVEERDGEVEKEKEGGKGD